MAIKHTTTENPMYDTYTLGPIYQACLVNGCVSSTYYVIDGHICDGELSDLLNAYGLDDVTVQPDGSCTFELPA